MIYNFKILESVSAFWFHRNSPKERLSWSFEIGVCYIHVARQSTSAVIDAMRSFRSASSSETCHIACLQRDGDCYSNQFIIFIVANDPPQLLQCTASASFSALSTAIDAARIAPTIIKKFSQPIFHILVY